MPVHWNSLGPFLGLVTSLSDRAIGLTYAADLQNVVIEDGVLDVRPGYRQFSASPADWFRAYGLVFLLGDDGTEEFFLVQRLNSYASNTGRPFFVTASGTRTEIRAPGPTTVSLGGLTNPWRAFVFQGYAYCYNKDESTNPLNRYVPGDDDSWETLSQVPTPSTGLTLSLARQPDGSTDEYEKVSFAGLAPASEITYGGDASSTGSSVNASSDELTIGHVADPDRPSSFQFGFNDMTVGDIDMQDRDTLTFPLREDDALQISPSSIVVELIADDGTTTFALDTWAERDSDGVIRVFAQFPPEKQLDRAIWDGTRDIQVSYDIIAGSSTANENGLIMGQITIGGLADWVWGEWRAREDRGLVYCRARLQLLQVWLWPRLLDRWRD